MQHARNPQKRHKDHHSSIFTTSPLKPSSLTCNFFTKTSPIKRILLLRISIIQEKNVELLFLAYAALEHRNITWSGRTSSIHILRTFPALFETHLLFSATGGAVYNTSKRREKPELPSKQNGAPQIWNIWDCVVFLK